MRPTDARSIVASGVAMAALLAGCDGMQPFPDAMLRRADGPVWIDATRDIVDAPVDARRADASTEPTSHVLPSGEVIAPDTPDDAAMRFGGVPDASRVPRVLYPASGTILPPSLRGFAMLIDRPLGDDLFEFTFAGASETLRVYRGCIHAGNPCPLEFDDVLYPLVVRAAAVSGEVRVTLRSTSTDGVSAVGSSEPMTLGFTQEPLAGAIYYFNTTGGRIARYDFDHPEMPPENYLGPTLCHGCHSLSRDGSRISAITRDGTGDVLRGYDVSTRTNRGYAMPSSLNAISPDGRRVVGSGGTVADNLGIALYNADDGSMLDTVLGFAGVDTAVWSPDGTSVVFAGAPMGGSSSGPFGLFRVAMSADRFSVPEPIPVDAPDGVARPAFTWDGAWLALNRGPIGMMPTEPFGATLWMIPASGGTPVHLANADVDGVGDARWPRFAPFTQTYQGEPLVWVTFSTPRRMYADEPLPSPQLWMSAVRPDRVGRGVDPSAPAFWLPFQVRGQGNHDAQWTEHVPPGQSCMRDADCPPGLQCVQLSSASGLCLAP